MLYKLEFREWIWRCKLVRKVTGTSMANFNSELLDDFEPHATSQLTSTIIKNSRKNNKVRIHCTVIPVVLRKAAEEVSKIGKPIGEVGCCESGMAERSHWWTERCLRSSLFLSLSLTIYLPPYLPTSLPPYLPTYLSIYLSIYLCVYLSTDLSLSLSLSHLLLITYLSIYLSTYLSIYLSLSFICLSV